MGEVAAQQSAPDPDAVTSGNLTLPAIGNQWPSQRICFLIAKPQKPLGGNSIGGLSRRVRAVQDDGGLVPEAVRSLLGRQCRGQEQEAEKRRHQEEKLGNKFRKCARIVPEHPPTGDTVDAGDSLACCILPAFGVTY